MLQFEPLSEMLCVIYNTKIKQRTSQHSYLTPANPPQNKCHT